MHVKKQLVVLSTPCTGGYVVRDHDRVALSHFVSGYARTYTRCTYVR